MSENMTFFFFFRTDRNSWRNTSPIRIFNYEKSIFSVFSVCLLIKEAKHNNNKTSHVTTEKVDSSCSCMAETLNI